MLLKKLITFNICSVITFSSSIKEISKLRIMLGTANPSVSIINDKIVRYSEKRPHLYFLFFFIFGGRKLYLL